MGFLDKAGLAHFWGKVLAGLGGKQDALTPDESITLQDGNIGVALPTKSLTRAEYEALPEEEKQAEKVYLVDEPPWVPAPLSVQEYDTEGGWHVRKWSDGYVEMTYPFTGDSSLEYEIALSGLDASLVTIPLNSNAIPYPLALIRKEESLSITESDSWGQIKFPAIRTVGSLEQSGIWRICNINEGGGTGPFQCVLKVTGYYK